jgi:hypothetical protein
MRCYRDYQAARFVHGDVAGTVVARGCRLDQLSLAPVSGIGPHLTCYTDF